MRASMRALRIHDHGGLERLVFEDLPDPVPGPGEVRLKVAATSLNHLDLWVRRGVPGHRFPLPITPGCDAAGWVERLGPGVPSWKEGDEVVVAPGRLADRQNEGRRVMVVRAHPTSRRAAGAWQSAQAEEAR